MKAKELQWVRTTDAVRTNGHTLNYFVVSKDGLPINLHIVVDSVDARFSKHGCIAENFNTVADAMRAAQIHYNTIFGEMITE